MDSQKKNSKPRLSVLILTQNEKDFWLEETIKSALEVGDEVIIVDGSIGSQDVEFIFMKFGDNPKLKIVSRPFFRPEEYSNQRNYGLRFCNGDWILNLDADEILIDTFKDSIHEILDKLEKEKVDAVSCEGVHFIYNLGLLDSTHEQHIFLFRLFKNNGIIKYEKNLMHGLPYGWIKSANINGSIIWHLGYVKDMKRHIIKQFRNNMRKKEIHTEEELIKWRNDHLFSDYRVNRYNGKLPKVLKDSIEAIE